MSRPPSFWVVFAAALHISATRRSILAFIPWWLMLCCLLPVVGVYFAVPHLRQEISGTEAVTILSAIAVVAGFFGSVSIAAIGQVQGMVCQYPFSSYLKEESLFDQFLFWPQFVLLLQIALLLVSTVFAAIIYVVNLSYWHAYVLAVDIGFLIYVCTKTWDLVDLIRKLTWHYEEYNRLLREHQGRGQ